MLFLSENSSKIFIIADPVSQFKNTPSLDLVTSTLSLHSCISLPISQMLKMLIWNILNVQPLYIEMAFPLLYFPPILEAFIFVP